MKNLDLDPDPYPENMDQQHCLQHCSVLSSRGMDRSVKNTYLVPYRSRLDHRVPTTTPLLVREGRQVEIN
jgi:hypothetical protein